MFICNVSLFSNTVRNFACTQQVVPRLQWILSQIAVADPATG